MSVENDTTYRRNLGRDIDVLGELHLALLQRALQVCLLHGLARVGVLVDESNVLVVLDDEMRLGAILDLLLEVALGDNAKSLASARM